jgi:hypothetical protein
VIRRGFQPGDLVLLVPFYATRAREYLGDLHPVATRDPLAEDLAVHPRVWVFAIDGEGAAVTADLLQAGLQSVRSEAPAPGVTVDLLAVEHPWTVGYDFLRELRKARVFHEHPGTGNEPCARWDEQNGQGGAMGRWVCPHDGEWFYVAPEWHYMDGVQRLCLWAHPPNGGRLVIQFPDVPLAGTLVGRAGHTLNATKHARERIDLDVEISAGEKVAVQRFAFGLEENWRPFAMALPAATTGTVSFAVSTPDAGANHFCFRADLRRPAEAR